MSEIGMGDVNENKPQTIENFRNIKPEKEMTVKELKDAVRFEFNKAAEEVKGDSGNIENAGAEKNVNLIHKEWPIPAEEKIECASHSQGEWDEEPGNSKFHPEKQEARDALEWYKQDGIDYKNGEPDFSKVSEATVQIKDMTSIRPHNFKQADEVCANQWNVNARDGRTDWTGREVEAWRTDNRYSWHERCDMKTMDLVQRDIHEACKHVGGVAECKRYEALNGRQI